MRRPFLTWALINSLFVVAVIAAVLSYDGHVHTAAKIAVASILVVYALGSAHVGRCAWHERADHEGHLNVAITVCPALGLLGTASGFLIAFDGGLEDLQTRVLGASTGLLATIAGISCMVVLIAQKHLTRA